VENGKEKNAAHKNIGNFCSCPGGLSNCHDRKRKCWCLSYLPSIPTPTPTSNFNADTISNSNADSNTRVSCIFIVDSRIIHDCVGICNFKAEEIDNFPINFYFFLFLFSFRIEVRNRDKVWKQIITNAAIKY